VLVAMFSLEHIWRSCVALKQAAAHRCRRCRRTRRHRRGCRGQRLVGLPIGHIHLPERCANLCFGGPRRNRLFMAASHSLYALTVNVQAAT